MRAPARSGCVALLVLAIASPARALSFDVSGGWDLDVGLSDLSGPAGSDLQPEYSSAANAVIVDVTGALLDTEPWTVTVHRVDVLWDAALSLSVLRTSGGSGGGTISGGLAFQEVTLVAQTFFQGTGNRSSIQIALKLAGVSVAIGSRILATQVVLTLLDT